MKSLIAVAGMMILSPILIIASLMVLHLFIEARYIPSTSMEPALMLKDKIIVEKITKFLKKPHVRGEMIIFYPPPMEVGGKDLGWDLPSILGRATGLPIFPFYPTFVKRVIGLPGDTIRVVGGKGVFVNGQLLDESSYIEEPAKYSLSCLKDIGCKNADGAFVQTYKDNNAQIVVPHGELFVLTDDRNRGEDSHVFGMINEDRIIGRVILKCAPSISLIEPPVYASPANSAH